MPSPSPSPIHNNTKYRSADTSIISFLDLPGELRNRIYAFALKEENAVASWRDWKGAIVSWQKLLGLNLLKNCREVYHESSSYFNACNIFVVSENTWGSVALLDTWLGPFSVNVPCAWIKSLGSQASKLREIILDKFALEMNSNHGNCCEDLFTPNRGQTYLDVEPLLELYWEGRLTARASFIQSYEPLVEYEWKTRIAYHPRVSHDTKSVTKVLRGLDQRLRRGGRS